ncbi:MAG: DUF711 family protein, partial [Dehalococcoidales bacterium]|nr:DUF711 family protein [Dehalococcoidales bacterium]
MINTYEILETIKMISSESLDIRTITMGISLRDCAHSDMDELAKRIYDKITRKAEKLVKTGEDIEKEYGIPITNKRISVTPISIIGEGADGNYLKIAKAMDRATETTGVDFIGGYSALIHKGYTDGDKRFVDSIPQALSETKRVCASVNIATTKAGINMDAVAQMGRVIKKTAELTAKDSGIGCARLVVFCNAPEDNPFMAGAFHGIGEPECVINVGVSGPGVMHNALKNISAEADFSEVAETIKKTAFKITRVGQLVATEASKRLGVAFGIVDLSLAPTPAIGDSIAN